MNKTLLKRLLLLICLTVGCFGSAWGAKNITSAQELCNLLNEYFWMETPDPENPDGDIPRQNIATLGGDGYTINVSSPNRQNVLDKDITLALGQNQVRLTCYENVSSVFEDLNLSLTSGTLFISAGIQLPKLTMTGGKLTIEDGYTTAVDELTVSGGEIVNDCGSQREGTQTASFGYVEINGDVKVYGNGEITDIASKTYAGFSSVTIVNGGNVSFKQVGLPQNKNHAVIINNGEVTFDEVTTSAHLPSSITTINTDATIVQKGGKVVLRNCRSYSQLDIESFNIDNYFISVEKGNCIVENNCFASGMGKSIIHVAGEEANVEVRGGTFVNYSVNTCWAIYQEKGNLTISGGLFEEPVVTYGGTLKVEGNPEFFLGDTDYREPINARIHILGNTKVELRGGYYEYNAVYADPSLSLKAEDLLPEGYGYYSRIQTYQPDHAQTPKFDKDHYLQIGRIKETASAASSTNDLYEAAKKANVGPSGNDVTVNGNEVVIKTPEGLAWFASVSLFAEGIASINQYGKNISEATIKLEADIDMSSYEWIPIQLNCKLFDGQGHRITGIQVEESCAAFFYSVSSDVMVANLIISGNFTSKKTIYANGSLEAAAFVVNNDGTILNCGVQNSTVGLESENITRVCLGGFAVSNSGSILNSYTTATFSAFSLDLSNCKYDYSDGGGFGGSYAGAFVADQSRGMVTNCYAVHEVPQLTRIDEHKNHTVNIEYNTESYNPSPDKEVLSEAAEGQSTNDISWKLWITKEEENDGYPIHGDKTNPTVLQTKVLLEVAQGKGSLKGVYTDDLGKDKEVTAGDTTVLKGMGTLVVSLDPEATLLKLTREDESGEEAEEVEVESDNTYTTHLDGGLLILRAYYGGDVVIDQEEDEPVGGAVDGNLTIDIDQPESELTFDNVTVNGNGESATTTIAENTNVTIYLSGTNDLGTLVNNGTVVLDVKEGQTASLPNVTVENKGSFTDLTGQIQVVTGNAALRVEPMDDRTVSEGETVTLVAEASAEDGEATYRWQKLTDGTWTDISPADTRARLRASVEGNRLTVSADEAGSYRCLVTFTDGNASTTLTTYAEVKAESKEEEPNVPTIPNYYNIYVEACEGATVELNKNVVKEGKSLDFSVKIAEGYASDGMRVTAKRGLYGYAETILPDADGLYHVDHIYTDIYICIEGVEPTNPTGVETVETVKAYSKDGSLFVYTPNQDEVRIFSISGALISQATQCGLKQYTVERGIYIIRIGDRIFKLRN